MRNFQSIVFIRSRAFIQISFSVPLPMGIFYLESVMLISVIPGFSFFAIEHIRKPGKHGKSS